MENPGGQLSKKPLLIVFLLDVSSSMGEQAKIQALNTGLLNLMPILIKLERDLGNVEFLIMAIEFSSGTKWIISTPTSLKDIAWPTLTADGMTEMGKAFKDVGKQVNKSIITLPANEPCFILVSDGQPNDDWKAGLKELNQSTFGQKSIRAAIGIGNDCDYSVLQEFIGNPEIKPCRADNPDEIANHIRTVTVESIHQSITPNNNPVQNGASNPVNHGSDDAVDNQADIW